MKLLNSEPIKKNIYIFIYAMLVLLCYLNLWLGDSGCSYTYHVKIWIYCSQEGGCLPYQSHFLRQPFAKTREP